MTLGKEALDNERSGLRLALLRERAAGVPWKDIVAKYWHSEVSVSVPPRATTEQELRTAIRAAVMKRGVANGTQTKETARRSVAGVKANEKATLGSKWQPPKREKNEPKDRYLRHAIDDAKQAGLSKAEILAKLQMSSKEYNRLMKLGSTGTPGITGISRPHISSVVDASQRNNQLVIEL